MRNKCRDFKSSVLPRTLMKSLPIPCEGGPGSIWSWCFHLTAQSLSLLTPPFGFSVVLSPALAGLTCLSLLPCSCRARLNGVKVGVRRGGCQPHSPTEEALPPLPRPPQSMWERAVPGVFHTTSPCPLPSLSQGSEDPLRKIMKRVMQPTRSSAHQLSTTPFDLE